MAPVCPLAVMKKSRGPEITPQRRAVIIAYWKLDQPLSYRKISENTGVAESTASHIFRHAVKNATAKRDVCATEHEPTLNPEDSLAAELRELTITDPNTATTMPAPASDPLPKEISLLELISKDCLDSDARTGRPKVLTEEEKDQLVATVKRNFETRRMKLVDLRREAGLSHVCDTTVYNALRERGIKAYREEFKFILSPENQAIRLTYCIAHQTWKADREWANYGFTDEMLIEIGQVFGECLVWREENERWAQDCVGAKKKQGSTVMCWEMIGYNYKGPFHVWIPESKEQREESEVEIMRLNTILKAQEEECNNNWVGSVEWQALKQQELAAARVQWAAEKAGAPKTPVPQTWRAKKFRIERIPKRSPKGGIDTYRYINGLCKPTLWPECKRLLEKNPEFCLMEDGAGSHKAEFTNNARRKEGITKIDWPANSPDFNPIEHIWTVMKRRILRRRGAERITTVNEMRCVLIEEWDKLTIEEINTEVEKLPTIMARCIAVNGGNHFHA